MVKLRQPPATFSDTPPPANYFRFRVTPDLVIAVGALVKRSGDEFHGEHIELLAAEHADPSELQAYEELLDDAMHGNSVRFARQDYVEEAWRIVDPVLGNATPVDAYAPGTWGPIEADTLTDGDGGWLNPLA
jgi:glucose-6-phosphate 1-dehydrogenase